jgi:hypothetical protein
MEFFDETTFAFVIGCRGVFGAFSGCDTCLSDLGRPTRPGILKREAISSRTIQDASPFSIPSLPASGIMFAYVKPQDHSVELINSIP